MRFFKHLIAAAAISLGGMASAATILDDDPALTLGAQIDSFAGAQWIQAGPSGPSITAVRLNSAPLAPTAIALTGDPFSLFYSDPVSGTTIAGFQKAFAFEMGLLQVLFDVVTPGTQSPTGEIVLAEFSIITSPIPQPFQTGTLTLFEVNFEPEVIPLPAGLPLLLTGLAGVALLRRRTRA